MRITYRTAGSRTIARVCGLASMLAAGLGILTHVNTTSGFAQDQPAASKPAVATREAADLSDVDSGDEGSSRAGRARGSDSLLGGIANAPGPVVVVTLVIAAMSFYLMALVVWMALNYRSSTTAAERLGA